MGKIRISQQDFDALMYKDPTIYYIINGKNLIYKGLSLYPLNKTYVDPYADWEYPVINNKDLKITQTFYSHKNNNILEVE